MGYAEPAHPKTKGKLLGPGPPPAGEEEHHLATFFGCWRTHISPLSPTSSLHSDPRPKLPVLSGIQKKSRSKAGPAFLHVAVPPSGPLSRQTDDGGQCVSSRGGLGVLGRDQKLVTAWPLGCWSVAPPPSTDTCPSLEGQLSAAIAPWLKLKA